jgi:hypothetical protein
MAYLGLVPSEHSSGGNTRRQGGITKAGNGAARRMLIEAAWSDRFPARISREQLLRQEGLAKQIRDIAWKAQERLCRRYRRLARMGSCRQWSHPRRTIHVTPTCASWLNAVEGFFAKLARQQLKRGIFRSIVELLPRRDHRQLSTVPVDQASG